MELAGYIPLALIPLSLAYAVVKHRLMDVELLFRRTLGYTLAMAVIIGICLAGRERACSSPATRSRTSPRSPCSARCSWSCCSRRSRAGCRRASTGSSSASATRFRKALLRLSQDLNADLDLARMAERLLEGVGTALGVKPLAVFLPDGRGSYAVFRSLGFEAGSEQLRLPAQGAPAQRGWPRASR